MTTEAVYGRSWPAANAIVQGAGESDSNYSSENWQPADTDTALTNDNEASLSEHLLDVAEVADDQVGELFDSPALDPPDVEDRRPGRSRGREDRPEVRVSRDQCPIFGAGSVQHRLVGRAVESETRRVHRVMTMLNEYRCQARRQVLVH